MRKRSIRLVAAACALLGVCAAAGIAAVLTTDSGGGNAAVAQANVPAAKEALEFARSAAGQATQGVPLPVAREKAGREGMREIWSGASAEAYADQAYPHANIDFAQVQESLEQAKGFASKGDSLKADWEEVGPFTLDVAREATQTNGIPTQWAGRTTALAVDPNCDEHSCRLYAGAAGGGVWRTDNALSRSPNWKPLTDGLDTTSVGHILIDPHDRSGKTIYLGTGEPSGSGDSEAGLGLYKSTDRGNHWSLVSGSRAVAKDRAIGEVAVDPHNPRHILIGTAVARHSLSGVTGGRYTPPNAPTLGVYESTDGGASFHLVLNRAQDPVNPDSPTGDDFFKGGVTDIEYDPVSPSTIYATLFDYGVFRSTDNGAHVAEHLRRGAGRRLDRCVLRHPVRGRRREARERQDAPVRLRGRQRGRQRRRRRVRRGVVRPPHRRRAGRVADVHEALEQHRRDARLQLVRHLCPAVLVRHADRVAAGQAQRGLDRRPNAVRRAASLRRGGSLERPQHHAVDQRRRVLHRHDR